MRTWNLCLKCSSRKRQPKARHIPRLHSQKSAFYHAGETIWPLTDQKDHSLRPKSCMPVVSSSRAPPKSKERPLGLRGSKPSSLGWSNLEERNRQRRIQLSQSDHRTARLQEKKAVQWPPPSTRTKAACSRALSRARRCWPAFDLELVLVRSDSPPAMFQRRGRSKTTRRATELQISGKQIFALMLHAILARRHQSFYGESP